MRLKERSCLCNRARQRGPSWKPQQVFSRSTEMLMKAATLLAPQPTSQQPRTGRSHRPGLSKLEQRSPRWLHSIRDRLALLRGARAAVTLT